MRLRFYKKVISVLLAMLVIPMAYAEPPMTAGSTGNYIGMQLGTSNMKADNEYLPNSAGDLVLVRPSVKGFGTRFFWGYQFTDYIALEGGYAYYSPVTYNIPNGNSPEWRIHGIDLLGKAILPLYWGFNAFGKFGAAILYYNKGGLLAPNPESSHDGANGITVRPEFGLGFGYAFTPNWVVDFSANRITQGSQTPQTTFLAVGLSYHAVDVYCGQFLC